MYLASGCDERPLNEMGMIAKSSTYENFFSCSAQLAADLADKLMDMARACFFLDNTRPLAVNYVTK